MRRNRVYQEYGFTLIEVMLALSVFSLILLMAYQTLGLSVQAKLRVTQSAERLSDYRSAYRALTNAFDSRAPFHGDSSSIEFDLTQADSPWLEGDTVINFVITDDHTLWGIVSSDDQASLNDEGQTSRLIGPLANAEFLYFNTELNDKFDGERRYAQWNRTQRPSAVELSWSESGELRRWRFDSR